jgi:1,4-alpha-glucan branching enzyme
MQAERSADPKNIQNFIKAMQTHHRDPHHFFGLHKLPDGRKVIRLWRPGASLISIELFGQIAPLERINEMGLFEITVPEHTTSHDYRVYHQCGLLAHDPYTYLPTVSELDLYLFGKGVHYQLYNMMGAKCITHQGVQGVKFLVWAPEAKRVSLVGDFNHWDGRINPMRCLGVSGVWELFVPGLKEGAKYKFEVKNKWGNLVIKADPYAFSTELRPATASVVAEVDRFQWTDQEWINRRSHKNFVTRPMNVYEVHLGSWKPKNDKFSNYREIAKELAAYCNEMGYTHVELLPIQEHPLDESWGYQVSGFYAVTSRYGSPEDFQWFVNHLHQHNIGVIVDWVPGHFPTDDFSLGRFDGTALYEHEDSRKGFHPHWNTYIFNFGRHEVANFLIANALFWFEKMHIDGLRVDAVASMLYLDYGREEGQWIPNQYGGKENLEAIEFIKHLNSIVHQRHPGILMIAEESTSFTGVTHSLDHGGLGFDLKWNMGWMNDTLRYISKDMIFRHYHHNDLTFGLLYAFSEKFSLVFSHDEVVHGKCSLLSKMPGDLWQKFANLRLLLSYQTCQPGKKLLFMGGEIGQWNEWNCKSGIEWGLLQYDTHRGVQSMVRDINHLYLQNPALWERDDSFSGFEWVDFSDQQNSVISYLRKGAKEILLCVHNFTPWYCPDYTIHLRNVSSIHEIFNTDAVKYGGSGKSNPKVELNPYSVKIQLAPLATMIFRVTFH